MSAPLPLSLAPSAERATPAGQGDYRFMQFDAAVKSEVQGALAGALDGRGRCVLHIPDAEHSPELVGLLDAHYARTGVRGLFNVTLGLTPGIAAETPRDAVRAAFGSAVDVLVIGRFMIGKDYWLMRQAFQ